MLPWKLSEAIGEENIRIAWAKLKPAEMYFALLYSQTKPVVVITPILYFAEHQSVYRESMPIAPQLPEQLIEVLPCIYEAETASWIIYGKLLNSGFVHSKAFQHYVESTDWSSYATN